MSTSPDEQNSPQGFADFARRATSYLNRAADVIMRPFAPREVTSEDRNDSEPLDWDPDMPLQPNSPGLFMLLIDAVLVLRYQNIDERRLEVTCYPGGGHLRDEEMGPGDAFQWDLEMTEDLTDEDVEAYAGRIEAWAMSETPLVIMKREGDAAVAVNPAAPDEWVMLLI